MPAADGCNNDEHNYDGSDCKGGVDDIELKDDNEIQFEDCPSEWFVAYLFILCTLMEDSPHRKWI